MLGRRPTPQYIKTVTATRREREEDVRDRERDGEGFESFCMTCEKQFLPASQSHLYCSEACRLHDLTPPPLTNRNSYYSSASPPLSPSAFSRRLPLATHTPSDGPDIIPRFSPTISRSRSYFNSDPYPLSSSYQAPPASTSTSPPHYHQNSQSSTALASLRDLAKALPKTTSSSTSNSKSKSKKRGDIKDSSSSDSEETRASASRISRTGSGIWNYVPFTSCSRNTTPSVTPAGSYTAPPYTVSASSYGAVSYANTGGGYAVTGAANGMSREDLYAYGKSHGGGGMDRPLPPRGGPGGYGHRPKSVDLVTPFGNGF